MLKSHKSVCRGHHDRFGALVLAIGAVAFLATYLVRHYRKAREETKLMFTRVLVRELGRKGTKFEFNRLVAQCKVPHAWARHVAEETYRRFCAQFLKDNVVSGAERRKLGALATTLLIQPEQATFIESKCKEERYVAATEKALSDGLIAEEESLQLQELRRCMGLCNEHAFQLTQASTKDGYVELFRRIISDRQITKEEIEEMDRYRAALGLSESVANEVVRDDVLQWYRECFYEAIQDGEVTGADERKLCWLKEKFGLPASEVRNYEAQLAEVKRLASYREGELPILLTTKLLDSGEICHWEDRCRFSWKTATTTKDADGELLVTSERLIFASPTRSFSFAPSKIVDISTYSNAITIQTSANRGTGDYFVAGPRQLEAIVVGLARRHKFLLSETFSSSQSRHIPDAIKRDVWTRDGGRCVRCRAQDYLEFDHVIPHGRGGANTVNNVQVLCRKCNLIKSDRI